jgi:hypothetical protein
LLFASNEATIVSTTEMVTNIFMIERFEVEKKLRVLKQSFRVLYAWNGEISSHVDGEIQIQMKRKT